MFCFFSLFIARAESRKTENRVYDYIDQLNKNDTVENEEQAIIWSMAELARNVDKTVTADEVEDEIGSRIHDIVDKIDSADTMMRKDFNSIRFQIGQSKQVLSGVIESTKHHIMDDMETFNTELQKALKSLVDTNLQVQEQWSENSKHNLNSMFSKLKNKSIRNSIIFFVFFQVLLVLGIVFYKKLEKQLRTLLI